MKTIRKTLASLSEEHAAAFAREIHEPWVELAEAVGYGREPFSNLDLLESGFSYDRLFVVQKAQQGDPEAIDIRDQMRDAERYWRLGKGDFPINFEERTLAWFDRNAEEMELLRRFHSPWAFALEGANSASDLATPWPEADEIFASFVFKLLKDYPFETSSVRSTRTRWSCSASIHGVLILLDVDKGSLGVDYGAAWTIRDFNQSWHICLPYFYSGGSFGASKAHPLLLQLERFFSSYSLVMPHVWSAIEQSVDAGVRYLQQSMHR